MSCAGFSSLLSTGRGTREPSPSREKRIWAKGRAVAVLHLRLPAAEWGRLDPARPGSAVRRAVCPQRGGTTGAQSAGWTGGTAEADQGLAGGLLRSGVGSEMEVCPGRNSQLLPA